VLLLLEGDDRVLDQEASAVSSTMLGVLLVTAIIIDEALQQRVAVT
jgi:hypothetical protein